MTEKEEKYGGDRSRSERLRTLFLRLFGCSKKNNYQEINQKAKEGERSSISFCKEDSFAPKDTMTSSFEAFRSGSLTRSSLKVREESDALANIKKREMVNELQERKGSQRWKSSQRWKDAQEKERKTKECKEGSPRVRLQRMMRASLR